MRPSSTEGEYFPIYNISTNSQILCPKPRSINYWLLGPNSTISPIPMLGHPTLTKAPQPPITSSTTSVSSQAAALNTPKIPSPSYYSDSTSPASSVPLATSLGTEDFSAKIHGHDLSRNSVTGTIYTFTIPLARYYLFRLLHC